MGHLSLIVQHFKATKLLAAKNAALCSGWKEPKATNISITDTKENFNIFCDFCENIWQKPPGRDIHDFLTKFSALFQFRLI